MAPGRNSLRHDTAWAMAGAVAQTASQAAVMLALARKASPDVVGQYALGLAIATPLNIFADRAFRTLQATAGDDDFPLSHYLAFRSAIGAAAVVVAVTLAVWWQLNAWAIQIVLLVALTRCVEGIAQ